MKERITWPLYLTLLILLLDGSIVLAFWAGLGNDAALISGLACLTLSIFFFRFTQLEIVVTEQELRVSRARIEKKYLGKVEILNEKEMRFLRGPGINPSAFMALRFWVKGGIKIEIKDARDPTPYWLVSTRYPKKLAQLLQN
jgi:hypothetical protein